MRKSTIIYQTKERIFAKQLQSKEWIEYSIIIRIKNLSKQPISIDMTFIPPHPFFCNMPESHSIKAENLSGAFIKVTKFLYKFGFHLK